MMPFELPRGAPRTSAFERLGGREALRRIIDDFYVRVAADPALRPLFPPNLGPGIEKQQQFMEEWLGGAPTYSLLYGQPMLRRRHFPFVIGRAHAARWLTHLRAAFAAHDVSVELIDEVMLRLEPLAYHMVNEGQDVPRDLLRDSGEAGALPSLRRESAPEP